MKQKASENKLLLYFLKDKRDSATREKVRDLNPLHLDWNYIIKITSSHGVGPMFYKYLEQINILPLIPPPIQQTIKMAYYQNAYKNFHIYKQLAEILSILQREGISVMLIKGAVLAQVIYKNIALRPMEDIDIMARRREDEKRIRAILTSRVNHSLGMEIEYLHHDIIPKDWPEKQVTDIIEKAWERAIPVEIAETKVWMPCPEDFLLFLILNLIRKVKYYMRYLFDISKFLQLHSQDINWESFINNLHSYGLQRQGWFVFDFIHSVLEISAPGQALFLRNTFHLSLREKIIWDMYKRDFFMVHIPVRIIETMTGHFLSPVIFPPKETLAKIYHKSPNSRYIYFYYLIRLYEKLNKYSRFALKFLYFLVLKR